MMRSQTDVLAGHRTTRSDMFIRVRLALPSRVITICSDRVWGVVYDQLNPVADVVKWNVNP